MPVINALIRSLVRRAQLAIFADREWGTGSALSVAGSSAPPDGTAGKGAITTSRARPRRPMRRHEVRDIGTISRSDADDPRRRRGRAASRPDPAILNERT